MKKTKKGYKEIIVYILAVFFCAFPWITYVKLLKYNEAEQSVFSSYEGIGLDFFLYYKEIALLVMAVFLLCWFIGERIFPDKVDNNVPLLTGNNKITFALTGVFLAGALVSTFFSEHSKTAWWGSPNEGEGMLTLAAYVILILAFYNYFAKESAIEIIKKAIYVVSGITVIFSLVEYLYKPLMEIELVQTIVSPAGYEEVVASATAEAFEGMVALTFNNPGYYGAFVILLFPFTVQGFFGAKNKAEKAITALLATGLMFCVIVSNATAALYVAIAEFLLLAIMNMWKSPDKRTGLTRLLLILGALVAAVVLYSAASGSSIWDIITNANSATGKEVENRFVITDIELKENAVLVQGEKGGFQVALIDNEIQVLDTVGNKLDAEYVDGSLVFADTAYQDVTVGVIVNSEKDSQILAKIMVDAGYDDTIDFFILSDGSFSGIGQNNAIIKDLEGVEIPEFLKQYYGMFTGRGYAWVNSLPILKQTIIKGVGPGNFAYYFKQQDYMGMLQTHGSTKYMIDRPHNMYLQYATNLGLPSMLCFFGLLAYVLVKAFKQWQGSKTTPTTAESILAGGMVSIVGFAISGLVNDSIITYTPTLCMIAGVVMATTYTLAGGKKNGK